MFDAVLGGPKDDSRHTPTFLGTITAKGVRCGAARCGAVRPLPSCTRAPSPRSRGPGLGAWSQCRLRGCQRPHEMDFGGELPAGGTDQGDALRPTAAPLCL